MKKYKELVEKIEQIFLEAEKEDSKDFPALYEVDVDIEDKNTWLEIKVSRMYDWYPLLFNYEISEKLSELFGTRDFTVNEYSVAGCETCDYGSEYGHVFGIEKSKLKL